MQKTSANREVMLNIKALERMIFLRPVSIRAVQGTII